MTYILPSECIRPLLHNCGCVTIKLRGVEAVATVHMDRKLEHYDPRDSGLAFRRGQGAAVAVFALYLPPPYSASEPEAPDIAP